MGETSLRFRHCQNERMAVVRQQVAADASLYMSDYGSRYELVKVELRRMKSAGNVHGPVAAGSLLVTFRLSHVSRCSLCRRDSRGNVTSDQNSPSVTSGAEPSNTRQAHSVPLPCPNIDEIDGVVARFCSSQPANYYNQEIHLCFVTHFMIQYKL